MSDEKKLKQARNVYETMCESLNEVNCKYERNDENLSISCTVQGDDLPMDVNITIDYEREIIILMSHMPFKVAENQRSPVAFAISLINNRLVHGNFDYNCLTGKIIFRMTTSYCGSLIGKEVFPYMIYCSCSTIDDYNDKLYVVAKKEMSASEILEYIKK